jgi:hypothetical protein
MSIVDTTHYTTVYILLIALPPCALLDATYCTPGYTLTSVVMG